MYDNVDTRFAAGKDARGSPNIQSNGIVVLCDGTNVWCPYSYEEPQLEVVRLVGKVEFYLLRVLVRMANRFLMIAIGKNSDHSHIQLLYRP